MPITIQAAGSLRKQIAPGTTVDGAATVSEALARFTIPAGDDLILLVNGRVARWDTPLQDGDVLQVLLGIGGGQAQFNFRF